MPMLREVFFQKLYVPLDDVACFTSAPAGLRDVLEKDAAGILKDWTKGVQGLNLQTGTWRTASSYLTLSASSGPGSEQEPVNGFHTLWRVDMSPPL
ncbi:hypothetical protein RvY_05430 [Ramazzottius varieornatus]|uniref:Uncharacterized protein n=1 Tax=Ramazzottius varieornatus TaxID=947166 RepID=A0A1D1UV12_RAMVA|nr:hypothetical protein RvY_05430 [Ramazzottius varieornatus]